MLLVALHIGLDFLLFKEGQWSNLQLLRNFEEAVLQVWVLPEQTFSTGVKHRVEVIYPQIFLTHHIGEHLRHVLHLFGRQVNPTRYGQQILKQKLSHFYLPEVEVTYAIF